MIQPALFTPELPAPSTPTRAVESTNLHDLVRTGRGGGRNARTGRCIRCRQPVLRGLDEDMCALLVEVDPTPLTPVGEAIALLAGRRTYDLVRTSSSGGRWRLTRRGRWRIAHGTDRSADVLPAHRCHDRTLEQLTAPTVHAAPVRVSRYDTCPF